MAQIVFDLVEDTTTTTGTGAKTLANSAPTLRRTLATAGAVTGDTVYLRISHATLNEWEIGNYTYNSAGPTVTLIGSPLASSNAGAAVNFSAGTKNVALVMPAAAQGIAASLTATKAAPIGADRIVLLDSADSDAPKLAALSTLPSSGATNLSYTPSTRVIASDTGTDATLPLVSSGDAGLAPASGGGTTNFLRADGSWAAPTPAPLPALGLWDYWNLYKLGTTGAAAGDIFVGAAVSAGTNNTAVPATGQVGYNSHGVFLRSGTTANGGYKYQTTSFAADYFGTISHKFRCQFMWLTSFTDRTVRIGYHDSVTSADAVDGAYFEIVGAVCSAKTANNSTRTTNATTVTLSLSVPYTFDIEVNAAGTSARFRVYANNSGTAILDVTITTNIPTTQARAFGAGIVATELSTTASDIGILYSLGIGTVAGFETRDVTAALGDIETILASV